MKQSLCAHVKSLGRWLECCQCHRVPMSTERLGMALSWGSHTHPTDTVGKATERLILSAGTDESLYSTPGNLHAISIRVKNGQFLYPV